MTESSVKEIPVSESFSRMFLVPVFLFAISVQLIYWSGGFSALSADQYRLLYSAVSWTKNPGFSLIDPSSPLFMFFLGFFVKIMGNAINAYGMLMLSFMVLFLIYFYRFSMRFTTHRMAGIFALALMVSSSLFMKVFTLPLAEAGAIAFCVMSLFYLLQWFDLIREKKSDIYLLLISQFFMFIAAGMRPECWLIALFCNAFIIYSSMRYERKRIALNILISLIPLLFPILWLLSLHFNAGIPQDFLGKPRRPEFLNLFIYPKFLAVYYTLALILMHASFICFPSFLKEPKRISLIIMNAVFLIFLMISSFLYSKPLPERSLMFLMIFLVPFVSTGTFILLERLRKASTVIVFILVFAIFTSAFLSLYKFSKPKESQFSGAIKVASYFNTLNDRRMIGESSRIMVERSGIDWCVIYVHSNLSDRIIFYDDLESIEKSDRPLYFVAKNPSLIDKLRDAINMSEETIVGNYRIMRYNPLN